MPLSPKTLAIQQKLFELVAAIPAGQTTTYLALARQLKIHPRQVGRLLHTNPDPQAVPCHRVIRSDGKLAKGYAFGGPSAQAKKLAAEGVVISAS